MSGLASTPSSVDVVVASFGGRPVGERPPVAAKVARAHDHPDASDIT
jgi:hypothetical protein